MRLKLSTAPPLPLVRCWYLVSDALTILHLKQEIVKEIEQLAEQQVAAHDVALDLEGFVLLDHTDIGILKDGDLVW